MGAALCGDEKDQSKVLGNHRRIEMQLKESQLMERRIVKILLLGSGDSGKSTIAKQMRILHTDGFNEGELVNYRYMIHGNFITSFHCIVRGIYSLGIPVPESEKDIISIFDVAFMRLFDLDHIDQIDIITRIWSCSCVKEVCKQLNDFYVPDNTTYLLNEGNRILQPTYRPSVQDILHARASTTGVNEIFFEFRRITVRLIDVGGQKTERRKWIHCFDNVSAILFVSSLSCYNENMEEDPLMNRLQDSVELFQIIYHNDFLQKCSFILFMNKRDIFEERIKAIALEKYFPAFEDWPKRDNLVNDGIEFIKSLYTCNAVAGGRSDSAKNRDGVVLDNPRHIYTHITNATDTKNIEFVFGATCDIILQRNLNKAGMT